MNADDKRADEVVASINDFISAERAAGREPATTLTQAEWAHHFGMMCERHGLDEEAAQRIMNKLPAAVDRYMKRAENVARLFGVPNAP